MSTADDDVSALRRPGAEPVFRHLDDEPWAEVKAMQRADGTRASVWEKWLAFSADPPYLSLYARYDAGMIVRRHGHRSPHVCFVISGDLYVGDGTGVERHCAAGTHVDLPPGAAFGPLRAGDAGCVLFEVMMGDPRSWGDNPAAFEAALAAHGATALADPPLEFPDWLRDLRHQWAPDPSQSPTDESAGSPAPLERTQP